MAQQPLVIVDPVHAGRVMASEFTQRHGDFVEDGHMKIYEDGATAPVNNDWRGFAEPPTNRRALLDLKRKYHEVKCRQALWVHDRLTAYLRGEGPSFEYPSFWFRDQQGPHDEAALAWFSGKYDHHFDMIAKIDEDIYNLPEEVAKREAEEHRKQVEAEARKQAEEQRNRVAAIKPKRPRLQEQPAQWKSTWSFDRTL